MDINYRKIFLQLLIILIFIGIRYLTKRFFHVQRHQRGWQISSTVLFWCLAAWNFGYYWIAFPIAIWMAWALILIALQVAHNHEFLYRRYWPPFWSSAMLIAIASFGFSLFAGALPLI